MITNSRIIGRHRRAIKELKGRKGIGAMREPEALPYGTGAVFADLYGNRFVPMERPG